MSRAARDQPQQPRGGSIHLSSDALRLVEDDTAAVRQKRTRYTSSGSSISTGGALSGVPSRASGYSKIFPS